MILDRCVDDSRLHRNAVLENAEAELARYGEKIPTHVEYRLVALVAELKGDCSGCLHYSQSVVSGPPAAVLYGQYCVVREKEGSQGSKDQLSSVN